MTNVTRKEKKVKRIVKNPQDIKLGIGLLKYKILGPPMQYLISLLGEGV